jgi:hypothetical protein
MDDRLAQLPQRIDTRKDLPITRYYADYLSPRIRTGKAGTLQFTQGKDASAFAKANATARLTKPNGDVRRLFVRTADSPFDDNHRLLASRSRAVRGRGRAAPQRAGAGAPAALREGMSPYGGHDLGAAPDLAAIRERSVRGRVRSGDQVTHPFQPFRSSQQRVAVTSGECGAMRRGGRRARSVHQRGQLREAGRARSVSESHRRLQCQHLVRELAHP